MKITKRVTAEIDIVIPDDLADEELIKVLSKRGYDVFKNGDTFALVEALESRGGWHVLSAYSDLEEVLETLSRLGVPRDLLDPIEDWADVPIPNELKLSEWRRWAQAS